MNVVIVSNEFVFYSLQHYYLKNSSPQLSEIYYYCYTMASRTQGNNSAVHPRPRPGVHSLQVANSGLDSLQGPFNVISSTHIY